MRGTCSTSANPTGSASNVADPNSSTSKSSNNNDEDLRFFTGKISSNNGKYVLEGGSPRGPYLLDDQKSAKQAKEYEGKHVRVIGVLEAASNTIHVRNIEEAAGLTSISFMR